MTAAGSSKKSKKPSPSRSASAGSQPPATAEAFWAALALSRVLDAGQVRAAREGVPPAQPTAQAVAAALVQAGRLTRFQAQAILAGKAGRLVLGEYVLLDRIGQGGMGQVLQAEHRRMKRIVALKLISGAGLKNPDAVARFEREAQAAARLIHPNIVTAFDAGESGGVRYFAMEYVAGRDLGAIVADQGPLPPRVAAGYVLQAARGLAYAHRQGVFHRDIKPSNLLVDAEGTVKILDMGLARVLAGDAAGRELTDTGQVLGTVDYMAPEQAEDTRMADARADIYSLGCTLYRLIRGEPLYGGDTLVKKILAHRTAPIPPLGNPSLPRADGLTERLEPVFRRMVAKQPEDRQQTAEQAAAELEACLRAHAEPSPNASAAANDVTTDFSWTPPSAAGQAPSGRAVAVGARRLVPAAERVDASPVAAAAEATQPMRQGDTSRIAVAPAAAAVVPAAPAPSAPAGEPALAGVQLRTSPPPRGQRVRRRPGLVGAIFAGLGGLVLAAAGVVIYLQTSTGSVRIEINDPSIEVTVTATGYKLAGRSGEIHVRPGEHMLRVKSGELAFDTKTFTLGSGENPAVKVELLPGELRAVHNEMVLGTSPRPAAAPAVPEPAAPALEESAPAEPAPDPLTPALAERMAQMPPPDVDGDWQVQGDSLLVPVADPIRPFKLVFGDPNWTDVDVRARVTLHEKWVVEFGLIARQEGKARWEFIVAGFANPAYRDLLPFTATQDGWGSPGRVLKQKEPRILPGTTHTIEVRLRGSRCTAYLDGEEVSSSESSDIPQGRVGLSTWGNTRFHDLEVRSPTGELLWSGLPPLPAKAAAE